MLPSFVASQNAGSHLPTFAAGLGVQDEAALLSAGLYNLCTLQSAVGDSRASWDEDVTLRKGPI